MIVVVMGPAGAGKSTVGRTLARAAACRFLDADSLHTPEHIALIQRGGALSDERRAPWLAAVAREITAAIESSTPLVVACSALKRAYRNALRPGRQDGRALRFVFLNVSPAELARRLAARDDHFAPPSILTSQLATLEPPGADEADALVVNGDQSVESIVAQILRETCLLAG